VHERVTIACAARDDRAERGTEAMFDELYNQRILALAADIPRLGRLGQPDGTASAHSKLCGSTVIVDVRVEGDRIVDFAHEVKACALGQASSSIMARHVIGASLDALRAARDQMRAMLKEGGEPPTGHFAEAEVLLPVKDYKARHASTMLTFEATLEAAEKAMAMARTGEPLVA